MNVYFLVYTPYITEKILKSIDATDTRLLRINGMLKMYWRTVFNIRTSFKIRNVD